MSIIDRRPRLQAAGYLTAIAAMMAGAGPVGGQGLELGLAPAGSYLWWNSDLGLEDGPLYGAFGTLGFGRYVRLQAGLQHAPSVDTRFDEIDFAGGENQVDATFASLDVLLRLGSAPLAPILAGGGGVVRFRPDGRDRTDHVFASWGGGLGLRLNRRLEASLLVHDVLLRMDRSLLTPDGASPVDPAAGDLRGSLIATLQVGLRVGGRPSTRADVLDRSVEQVRQGGTDGLQVPVEVFGGLLRFDDALALDDQARIGARAGVDLGSYFGLRGSYWHGVQDGLDAFEDVWGWAGEAQFDLGRASGLSPFLLMGYGQTLFDDATVNDAGLAVPDQNAVVLGAGVGFPIGDRMRVLGTFRDHITTLGDLADASKAADLRHNLSLDVGVSYLLFQQRSGRTSVTVTGRGPSREEGALAEVVEPVTAPPAVVADTAAAGPDVAVSAAAAPDTAVAGKVESYHSDQVVTIPVPAVGELYVRYGPPPERAGRAVPDPQTQTAAAVAATPDPVVPDSAAIAALIRAELARWAARIDPAAATAGQAPPRAQRAAPAPTVENERLATLQEQVRELNRLVREGMAREPSLPSVTVVTPSAVAGPDRATTAGTSPRSSLIQAVEGRVGPATIRDGRLGVGAAIDLSFRSPGPGMLRPFLGIEASRSAVRTTLAESSVFGTVRNVGASVGAYVDAPRFDDFLPSLSLAVTAVGGSVSGDTEQDGELMDRIYEGFRLGADVGVHVGWQRPGSRFLVTAALSRLMAGSRSRWALEGGIRLPLGTRRPAATSVPTAARAEVAPPPPDTIRDGGLADSAAVVVEAPVDSAAARTRTELLSRLTSLEQAVSREADERAAAAARQREYADVRRDLEELVGSLPDVLAVRSSDRGLEVILGGGMFAVGSATLGGSALAAVERIGTLLRSAPETELLMEGHTDATGPAAVNTALSLRRAQAVRSALIRTGLPPSRLTAVGSGERAPLADNDTSAGRARNRRVELVLLDWPPGTTGPHDRP